MNGRVGGIVVVLGAGNGGKSEKFGRYGMCVEFCGEHGGVVVNGGRGMYLRWLV